MRSAVTVVVGLARTIMGGVKALNSRRASLHGRSE
jgi:hypothetical protein